QGHRDAGQDGQRQHAEADPDQAEQQLFEREQRRHGAHGAADRALLAGGVDGAVQVAVQHGPQHGGPRGAGAQAIGRHGDQQVDAQPVVAGVGHQVAVGEQGGQQADHGGGGQQQEQDVVQAQQEVLDPEHDHAQPEGGGQGQRPAQVQARGHDDGGGQADAVQGDGPQQATAAEGAGGAHVARPGDGAPQGDAQYGV